MNVRKKSLKKHYEWQGKIETAVRVPVFSRDDLSLAYTPGVAEPCLAIKDDKDKSFALTRRWNVVPVITDGTAVLGLGNIGAAAGLPVMEGKAALFKAYGDVDAYPLAIGSVDVDEIVSAVKLFADSWGGVNLEDIAAPRCFEIERRLIEELDIPVFHDDQHGTAIVVAAALENALKLAQKKISDVTVTINGAGAAGIAIAEFLKKTGVKDIIVHTLGGIIEDDERFDPYQRELAKTTNKTGKRGDLAVAIDGADVFIGVSAANCVSEDMIRSMNSKAIVFAMANPTPEISREAAINAGAFIVGTGSSEKPNQINNVLVFPGLFRGALDARAKRITFPMMQAAARAIAECAGDVTPDRILPYAYDLRVHKAVAKAVYNAVKR